MNKNILICGVGGQGTVLASKIIAAAAADAGETVHSAETIGMAQRGGPVTSHVRIGEDVFSPLIPEGSADIILAFEPGEALRNLRYLREGGLVIVNKTAVMPVTEALRATGYEGAAVTEYLGAKCSCIFVDSDEAAARFGSPRVFNVYLTGVACGTGRLGISKETLLARVEKSVPAKFKEINVSAFLGGFEKGSE